MRPETEQDLAEAIKSASGPLRISGGGTRDIGAPGVGEALSTSGLSGISLYEPGALTLVARAGTPMADIEAALNVENQRLAFEPMDHRALLGTSGTPTIGGVVSANVSGPRRISVGACRDHTLGVRFVDGDGTVTKNGGRVMKNVTGYDLVKLLTGAYGTLGVLSEVSLKVLPKPATSATLTLENLNAVQAVAAMSAALGSAYEVTGAAMDQCGAVHLRLEGFEASVAYRIRKLSAVLAEMGPINVTEDAAASEMIWADIRDVSAFSDHEVVIRASIKPSHLPEILASLKRALMDQDTDMPRFDVMADWGGGLVWFAIPRAPNTADAKQVNGDDATEIRTGQAVLEAVRSFCQQHGGHATLIKAPTALRACVRVFQPENSTISALSSGLRARFDPRGILNPGLMG